MINAFKPKIVGYEERNIKEENEFELNVVLENMQRLKIMDVKNNLEKVWVEFSKILKWENKFKSTLFLVLYILVIYCFQPWMMTFAILLPLLKNSSTFFMEKVCRGNKRHFLLPEDKGEYKDSPLKDRSIGNVGSSDEESITKPSLKGSINRLYSAYESRGKAQQILIEMAQFGERVRNIVQFKVPFLSLIALLMLIMVNILFYYVPLRYIIMTAGVDKILKGLISPNSEGCLMRLLHFISKAPDNEDLKDWDLDTINRPKSYAGSISRPSECNGLTNKSSLHEKVDLCAFEENTFDRSKECKKYISEDSMHSHLEDAFQLDRLSVDEYESNLSSMNEDLSKNITDPERVKKMRPRKRDMAKRKLRYLRKSVSANYVVGEGNSKEDSLVNAEDFQFSKSLQVFTDSETSSEENNAAESNFFISDSNSENPGSLDLFSPDKSNIDAKEKEKVAQLDKSFQLSNKPSQNREISTNDGSSKKGAKPRQRKRDTAMENWRKLRKSSHLLKSVSGGIVLREGNYKEDLLVKNEEFLFSNSSLSFTDAEIITEENESLSDETLEKSIS